MSGLGGYAQHEAEMEIARATAVRALMQTGATHDEAVTAVREHIRTPEARRENEARRRRRQHYGLVR